MTATARPARRSGWFGYLLAAVVCAVVVLAAVSDPPTAQVAQVSPADGAALDTAPADVVVTFDGPAVAREFHLSVVAAGGGPPVAAGPARLEAQRMVLPLSATPAGEYLAAYHVLLVDGQQLSGFSRFTVGTGMPPAPASLDTPSIVPGAHQHGSDDPVNLGLLLLDLVLVLVAAVVLLRRPKIRENRPWTYDSA
ncbi:copper resistance CopC family protein [Micromonospora radicis]|uniref:copper resistance CopC family protein n=1 Tax=Micromonospora radicis TaxID=1894971 RepID=UPI00131491AE|nr:copper resistance CopC family protein [Micromonospora radicis]